MEIADMRIRSVAGGSVFLAALVVVVASAGASNAPASRAKLIHAFTGAPDGDLPMAGALVLDGAGNLYGTTPIGGTGSCSWRHTVIGCGTVYELTPAASGGWTEHILYSFKNFADGMQPYGTVTLGAGGSLYGVTTAGGVLGQGCVPPYFGLRGCGTAFELTPHPGPAWTKKTLHVFSGGKDGGLPESDLVADPAGNLYGSLYCGGGIDSCYGEDDLGGAFFELEPVKKGEWRELILYAFTLKGGQGCCPLGNLTVDHAGTIYGTTGFSAYAMTRAPHSPRWREKTLFRFGAFAGGWYPQGGLAIDATGNLYGTTYDGGDASCPHEGCGVDFELTRAPSNGAWSETVMHTFTGGADGALPYTAGLALDSAGRLYGTTSNGGDLNCNNGGGCGVAFMLQRGASGWSETVLHTFEDRDNDGGMPASAVILNGAGRLFGTTTYGGSGSPYTGGTVFEL
jgi:hypothetical protein